MIVHILIAFAVRSNSSYTQMDCTLKFWVSSMTMYQCNVLANYQQSHDTNFMAQNCVQVESMELHG